MADFECWLSDRLNALKVDAEVFSSYIQGILEGDEKHDEKVESIEGILESAAMEATDVAGITEEIIQMFNKHSGIANLSGTTQTPEASTTESQPGTFEDKVRTIFSQQTAKAIESANRRKVLTSEENAKLRTTILSQYAEVEDPEAESAEADTIKVAAEQSTPSVLGLKEKPKKVQSHHDDPLLMKNTNAQQVLEAEKLKRERSKQESEAKKAKDKLDRENQKKKEVERKEKEKQRTQKGERRR